MVRKQEAEVNDVLVQGKANVIMLMCKLVHNLYFVLYVASELGVAIKPVAQYRYAWQLVLVHIPFYYKA